MILIPSKSENDINTKLALQEGDEEVKNLLDCYHKALDKGLLFDVRCFNLPKEERMNYKKEFAQEIDKKYATFLFYMFNNNCNSVHETLEQMANNKENF